MKRKFTFLAAAIALFAFLAIPLGMRGQSDLSTTNTSNVVLTTTGGENASTCSVVVSSVSYDGIKVGTSSKGGKMCVTVPAGTAYLHVHAAAWKGVSGLSLNISGATTSPASISLTADAGMTSNSPFTLSGAPEDYYFVIALSNITSETTITFTTSTAKRFVIWGVNSEEAGSTPTVLTPSFIPNGSSFLDSQEVTIACATDGATIYYTTNGNDPTTSSNQYTAPFTLTQTTTVKAFAVKSGYNNSFIATATFTKVEALENIAALTANTTNGTYYVNLDNAVVTYVNGNNAYIQDASGAVAMYKSNHGLTAGDVLEGTAMVVFQLRNQNPQITDLSGVTPTSGTAPDPTIVAASNWNYTFNEVLSQYFKVTGATLTQENSKYYVQLGDDNVQLYKSGGSISSLDLTKTYTIIGFPTLYNSTKELQIYADPEAETSVATPTFNPEGGTYTEVQSVTISCETPNVTIYYTTNGNDPDDESTLYEGPITVGESMTIKAIAYDANDNTSAIGTAEYVINLPVPAQTFNLIDGHNPVEGETYLIVDLNSGKALTSANGSSSSPVAVEVTIEDNQIITDNVALQWTFEATEGGYIIHPLGSSTTWLCYTTTNNTGIRVGTNDAKVWTLDITDEGSNYHGFKNNATERYIGVYQSTDWRAYTTIHANIKETQIALFVLGDAPAPAPSITAANVNIAYDVTGGEIEYTINNMVESGVLTAATESEWLDLGEVDVTVPFYCDPNTETTPRAATVTLTYTYNRETVTKDVTVTQAAAPVTVVYTTIPELFAAATGTATEVLVTFDSWVVSGVSTNGKNVFVTDNEGHGFVIFNNGGGLGEIYSVGDVLTGTEVSCSLVLYHGFAELTGVNAEDLTIVAGGTVTETNIAMAELAGVNTGALVSYDGLTCSVNGNNYYLTDGTTTIQVYTALYAFEALEDGKVYNITGIYQQYNTTKEVLPRSAADIEEVVSTEPTVTITDDTVNVPAEGGNGTITVTYENIEVGDIDPEVLFFAADGTTSATYDWITVTFNEDNNAVYTVEANDGEARTAYFKVNEQSYSVLSNLVTVNQAGFTPGPTGDNFVRINSLDQLTDGSIVVIASRYNETANNYLAMKSTIANKIEGTEFESLTSNNDEILASSIVEDIDNYYWIVNVTTDGYTFTNANGDKIGYNSSTNFATNGEHILWSVASGTSGAALVPNYDGFVVTNVYSTTTNTTRSIALRDNDGNKAFGVYANSNMNGDSYNFFLDFFVQSETPAGTPLFISGYNGSAYANGGYHLIATPVDGIDPANVTNMTNGNYDLYMFDQSGDDEWVNYRQGNNQFAFNSMVAGMGYLYAHDTDITLYFEGDLIEGDSYDVSLVLDTDSEFPGWNLVGNSFTVPASIGDRDYYEMHENGRDLIQTSGAIDPMQGIFVIAETDEEELTFSKTIATGGSKVVMNVTSDRSSLVDRATIRFGEGRQLRKIQLNPDNTKIYITEGNTDYAVVRSSDEAEIPVSFKTAENGTYTINFSTEEVEMEYMHLIDNMTGADVDLLATPSYTFEARTTDYASRFRLVFATTTGVSENSENNFAFYNGGNWVINNMGDATLQVVDMLGHILSSETINGNASISIDQVPGVYMIRLVSGNDVKVQKVIIK